MCWLLLYLFYDALFERAYLILSTHSTQHDRDPVVGVGEHSNETYGPIKNGESLKHLSNNELILRVNYFLLKVFL